MFIWKKTQPYPFTNPYFRHSAFVSFGTDHRLEMELDFASLAKHEQDCY
jgi:hypothetical protein